MKGVRYDHTLAMYSVLALHESLAVLLGRPNFAGNFVGRNYVSYGIL